MLPGKVSHQNQFLTARMDFTGWPIDDEFGGNFTHSARVVQKNGAIILALNLISGDARGVNLKTIYLEAFQMRN